MTRTAIIRIVDGSNSIAATVELPSRLNVERWAHIAGPLGVHVVRLPTIVGEAFGFRLTAGVIVGGRGYGIRFDRIEIDFGFGTIITLRPSLFGPTVFTNGAIVQIGTPGMRNCIPPRGAVRVRVMLGERHSSEVTCHHQVASSAAVAPGVRVDFPAAVAKKAVRGERLGVGTGWRSLGPFDNGAGSGHQLDFLAGSEGECEVVLERAAGVMARHHCDALDAATGRPLPASALDTRNYYLDGQWSKTGQLPEFTLPKITDPNGDMPEPQWWGINGPGEPCPYEKWAAGYPAWSGPVKHNHEHARRTTAALEGAINCWADPISVIDARSAAHDALFALARQLPALAIEARRNAKQGHGTLGWRGLSWQADALALCPETSTHATTLAHLIAAVETKTATCNRRTPGYPYNPNAWIKSDAIPDPLPLNHEATQLMEEIIRAFTLARAGYVDSARRLFECLFVPRRGVLGIGTQKSVFDQKGFIPKFASVAVDGVAVDRLTRFAGGPDYFQWTAVGLACFLARDPRPYVRVMLRMGSPLNGTVGGTLDATLKLLREQDVAHEQTGIAIAALEAFG